MCRARLTVCLWLVLPLLCVLPSTAVLALDPSRLTLPKRYYQYWSDLVTVARAAENTERCREVLQGRLLPIKQDEPLRFLIVCRDRDKNSYNLQYGLQEGKPQLLAEQATLLNPQDTPVSEPAVAEQGTEAVAEEDEWGDWESWEAVEQPQLATESGELEGAPESEPDEWGDWESWEAIANDPSLTDTQSEPEQPAAEDEWGDWGDWDSVMGNKAEIVTEDGRTLPVTRETAWQLCLESIEKRVATMLAVTMDPQQHDFTQEKNPLRYRFQLPFTAENPRGDLLRFVADCELSVQQGIQVNILRGTGAQKP